MQPTVEPMKLALYAGPAKSIAQKLIHWAICLFTWSRYSHVELVIDGRCFSASNRDGGVRAKFIDLYSGRWDVIEIPERFQAKTWAAIAWFRRHDGENYDWIGCARLCPLLHWLPARSDHHFCSKAIAEALGLPNPDDYTPQRLLDYLRGKA